VVPDALVWVVRLRAASREVEEVANALRRRGQDAGLQGPAGDALSLLVADVARLADQLAGECGAAADAVAQRSRS
jgi:hypothetical protein